MILKASRPLLANGSSSVTESHDALAVSAGLVALHELFTGAQLNQALPHQIDLIETTLAVGKDFVGVFDAVALRVADQLFEIIGAGDVLPSGLRRNDSLAVAHGFARRGRMLVVVERIEHP